jgi:hypothetical protein
MKCAMKTARRNFLAAASLAAASPHVWPACPPSEADADGPRLMMVFDEQQADSRAYAWRARLTGARIVPLRDDIGMLWFASLMPVVASPGHVLAGLTRHADAFLLAGFAGSIGMRMTQRITGARGQADALVAWRLEHRA